MGLEGIIFAVFGIAFAYMYINEKDGIYKLIWLVVTAGCFIGAFGYNYTLTSTTTTTNYPAYSVITKNVSEYCVSSLSGTCPVDNQTTFYPAYNITTTTINNETQPSYDNPLIELGSMIMLAILFTFFYRVSKIGLTALLEASKK